MSEFNGLSFVENIFDISLDDEILFWVLLRLLQSITRNHHLEIYLPNLKPPFCRSVQQPNGPDRNLIFTPSFIYSVYWHICILHENVTVVDKKFCFLETRNIGWKLYTKKKRHLSVRLHIFRCVRGSVGPSVRFFQ